MKKVLDILSNDKVEVYIESNLIEILNDYLQFEEALVVIETIDQLMCLNISNGKISNIFNTKSKVNYSMVKQHFDNRRERKFFEEIINHFDDLKVRGNIQKYFPNITVQVNEAFEVKFTNDVLTLDQSIRCGYAKVYVNKPMNEYYSYNYDVEYINNLCHELQNLLFENSLELHSPLPIDFLHSIGVFSNMECTISEIVNENEVTILKLLEDYSLWSFAESKNFESEEVSKDDEQFYLIDHTILSQLKESKFNLIYRKFNHYETVIRMIDDLDALKDKIFPLYGEYLNELEFFEAQKLEAMVSTYWNDGESSNENIDNAKLNEIFEAIYILEGEYSDKVVKLNKLLYSLLYFVEDEVDINTLNVIRDLKFFIELLKNIQYLSLN